MAVGDNGNVITLFENQASDATSGDYAVITNSRGHYISVSGSLGGGTLAMEMQVGGVWAPIDGGSFTEIGVKFLEGGASGKRLRAVLSGSTGASVTVGVTK